MIPYERIAPCIFFLRGHKVLLDSDLAHLYDVATRALNQAVRRNARRFPDDFMFQLTRAEIARISQSVTSSRYAKLKYSKRVSAFTEQGVAMLSTVLHSERAIEVNIQIMRTFVRLREMITSHKDLVRRLDVLERRYDARFRAVFDAIRQLMEPLPPPSEPPKRRIGFH